MSEKGTVYFFTGLSGAGKTTTAVFPAGRSVKPWIPI